MNYLAVPGAAVFFSCSPPVSEIVGYPSPIITSSYTDFHVLVKAMFVIKIDFRDPITKKSSQDRSYQNSRYIREKYEKNDFVKYL